jgi:signal transduction histidine kinase
VITSLDFPAGHSETARAIRAIDWHESALGPPQQWPAALKTALNLILNSPESMYVLWGPQLLFFHNDAYAPILGPRKTNALGAVMQALWGDVWDQVSEMIEQALSGQAYQCQDLPLTMARFGVAEQTWWSFSFSPLFDEHGNIVGMFCTTRETTKRVLNEQALRISEARRMELIAEAEQAQALHVIEETLHQSQKMEAVGQLTGGLAHDLNNLLMGVTGNIELLQNRVVQGRTSELGRYITAALEASRRAAALTHRLLAFSRRQTLAPKTTHINQLVEGMADLISTTIGPSIVMQIQGAEDLWPTIVDPHQLENALLNLCINARDAMPDGGQLLIETHNRVFDKGCATQGELASGSYIELCVSDTGTGMTADVVARAFDPFFTTKPIGMGTGLGLSMIYGFARQSGGDVRIDSTPGTGSKFHLFLPMQQGQNSPVESSPEPEQRAVSSNDGGTVLVVDDEPAVRLLITEVLEELGYDVLLAHDGAEALTILQSKAVIDLLISDVGLPGAINGRQVADAARSLRPTLNVLFVTGYAENAVLGEGALEPGMHVLTKPFSIPALTGWIGRLLEGNTQEN